MKYIFKCILKGIEPVTLGCIWIGLTILIGITMNDMLGEKLSIVTSCILIFLCLCFAVGFVITEDESKKED